MPNLPAAFAVLHPSLPIVLTAGVLHCTIGLVAARIAHQKGRKLSVWLPIGLIVGTPTLIAAWRLKPEITAPPDKFSE